MATRRARTAGWARLLPLALIALCIAAATAIVMSGTTPHRSSADEAAAAEAGAPASGEERPEASGRAAGDGEGDGTGAAGPAGETAAAAEGRDGGQPDEPAGGPYALSASPNIGNWTKGVFLDLSVQGLRGAGTLAVDLYPGFAAYAELLASELPPARVSTVGDGPGAHLCVELDVDRDGTFTMAGVNPLTVSGATLSVGGEEVAWADLSQFAQASSLSFDTSGTRRFDMLYYSYTSTPYIVDADTGAAAWCLDPSLMAPGDDHYGLAAEQYSYSHDADRGLSYILAHGYGGSAGDWWGWMASDRDRQYATQMAVWVYLGFFESWAADLGGDKDYTATVQDMVDCAREFASSGDASLDGYAQVWVSTNSSGYYQPILAGGAWVPDTGSVEIVKASSNAALTDGNPCYSLEGAEYGVYSDPSCGPSSWVATMVTDASGRATASGLAPGTYWVKEAAAPRGYALDPSAHQVSVPPGQTARLDLYDAPQSDPVLVVVQKLDAETGEASSQGAGTLAGAEFTVSYYAGYYDRYSLPPAPTRTWVIRTDDQGRAALTDQSKVSGDDYYTNSNGANTFPLGTVAILETKAPEGYALSDTALNVQQVTGDGSHLESVSAYVTAEFSDIPVRGGISLRKVDRDTGEGLAGALFEVLNSTGGHVVVGGQRYEDGEVVATLATGQDGWASTPSDLLPLGTYTVREKAAPEGYAADAAAQSVTVSSGGQTAAAPSYFEDGRAAGGVSVTKADDLTPDGSAQGSATLAGAVFEVVATESLSFGGERFDAGDVVATLVTDGAGKASTAPDALPCSTYIVREKAAPEGYGATARQQTVTVVAGSVTECPSAFRDRAVHAGLVVQKVDADTGVAAPQGAATLEGAVFEVVNSSPLPVMVGGRLYGAGDVVATLVTDSSGRASTPTTLLPYGDYTVREKSAPAGYLANGGAWEVSVRADGALYAVGDPA